MIKCSIANDRTVDAVVIHAAARQPETVLEVLMRKSKMRSPYVFDGVSYGSALFRVVLGMFEHHFVASTDSLRKQVSSNSGDRTYE